MKLLLEIGNTRLKWVLLQNFSVSNKTLARKGSLYIKDLNSSFKDIKDNLLFKEITDSRDQILKSHLYFKKDIKKSRIEVTWLSVGPEEVEKKVIQILTTIIGKTPPKKLLTPYTGSLTLNLNYAEIEVRCSYDDPKAFGADRWAALVGLAALGPPPVKSEKDGYQITLVSSGTATVVDHITWKIMKDKTWKCELTDGMIYPGFEKMYSAISFVKNINPKKNRNIKFNPRNTNDAINSGIAKCQVSTVSNRNSNIVLVHGGCSKEWIRAFSLFKAKDVKAIERPWLVFEGIHTLSTII